MSPAQIPIYWFDAIAAGACAVPDPGAGGTLDVQTRSGGFARIGAGLRRLPGGVPEGVLLFVRSTGVSAFATVSGDYVAAIVPLQVGLFISNGDGTWFVSVFTADASLPYPGVYTTSRVESSATPVAGAFAGSDHVVWNNAASGPVAVTTPTASQLFAATPNAVNGASYFLTVVNEGGGDVTLIPGLGVSISEERTVSPSNRRLFLVTLVTASIASIQHFSQASLG